MTFVHEDRAFDDLLQIAAEQRMLSRGLVEKDYWVTHTLWALQASGVEFWFKGGTSLSKGFGLIQRFSEDLDLKIDPGGLVALPKVTNWHGERKQATAARQAYFETLAAVLSVPGARVALDHESVDRLWRGANLRVTYPGRYLTDLPGTLRPFVQLEVGSARVTPFVACDLTSFAHDTLESRGQRAAFVDNRPRGIRCVHPLVTLIEKIDGICRRFQNERTEPAAFVRHYEDAAHIIRGAGSLPSLADYADVSALANEMLAQRQITVAPSTRTPAFVPDGGPRWTAIRAAHAAIAPLFWGPRLSLDESCTVIRDWIIRALVLPRLCEADAASTMAELAQQARELGQSALASEIEEHVRGLRCSDRGRNGPDR